MIIKTKFMKCNNKTFQLYNQVLLGQCLSIRVNKYVCAIRVYCAVTIDSSYESYKA